jgi:hypothetical protein
MIYGCNGKPAQSPDATYVAQDGWAVFRDSTGHLVRTPRQVEIKAAFGTIGCNYDKPTSDPKCAGCWQAKAQP